MVNDPSDEHVRDGRRPAMAALCDWLDDRLEPEAARAVDEAIASDPGVRASLDWLMSFRGAARDLPLVEPPPPIIAQRLDHHFARWTAARRELHGQPHELHGVPMYDSRRELVASGFRDSPTDEEAVHLVYETEVADVLVDVYGSQGGSKGALRLKGQVLPTSDGWAPVFEASVHGPDQETSVAVGDESGHFALADVLPSATEIRLSNGDLILVLPVDLRRN